MPSPRPSVRPRNPCFSSGPCAKRPGWTLAALEDALLGRSHRAAAGQAKLGEVIARSRDLLGIPADYLLGIVPASDTGAVEIALWSLLGARGVDGLALAHREGQTQVELGVTEILARGPVVPLERLRTVLLHPLAGGVEEPQVELRGRVALLGGRAVPAHRLGVVRLDPLAANHGRKLTS